MESNYDKVVKLTAEILKSWTPDPGTVSPFSSSSSNHSEINDNHLEYYVQQDSKKPLHDAIASIFNSNFWTNGGEKMTEKTLDIDSSVTSKEQYNNSGSSTTEPDPQSEIAITKMDRPKDSQDEEGKGNYSTTANTTTDAPKSGETTEPTQKADGTCPDCGKSPCECTQKADGTCPDCNNPMTMCNCAGMSKSDDGDDKEPDADEDDSESAKKAKELKKAKKLIKKYKKAKKLVKEYEMMEKAATKVEEPIQKNFNSDSKWQGAFSPNIKRGM